MNLKKIFLSLLFCPLGAFAQPSETPSGTALCGADVVRTTNFLVGGGNQYDAYLSPLTYRGTSFGLFHEAERPVRLGARRRQRLCTSASATVLSTQYYLAAARTKPSAWAGQCAVDVGVVRRWTFRQTGWHLQAGGAGEVFAGGAYLRGGGNNPANGTVGLHLALTAKAVKDFRIRRSTGWSAEVALTVPLVGVAFAQQYGTLYYELYLGHRDGQIRCATPFNSPSARLTAQVVIPAFRHADLTVGYLGDAHQQRMNNLTRHAWNNALMLGFRRRLCFKPPTP